MTSAESFYDDLAGSYDRLYPDWPTACREQGAVLDQLLREAVGSGRLTILDGSVGIGTQLIGLAGHGHRMTGTDLSPRAVERAADQTGFFQPVFTALV